MIKAMKKQDRQMKKYHEFFFCKFMRFYLVYCNTKRKECDKGKER